ncbi:MAG: S-methyl-5'-thioinosine phosphorylase [bacterium]
MSDSTAIARTAIIGGSGFDDELTGFVIERRKTIDTPYGAPSDALIFARANERVDARVREDANQRDDADAPISSSANERDDATLVFLSRHGVGHAIAPHQINYRANLWALKRAGATRVVALCAVGAIADLAPATLALPHQLIDYTWGRAHTFFDAPATGAPATPALPHQPIDYTWDRARTFFDAPAGAMSAHIVFTRPYADATRAQLLAAARRAGVELADGAVYAATQGPRLETAAEIDRLERDGADIVGMTGMPEAALAREIGLDYAALAIVVNPAAGRGAEEIGLDRIGENLRAGIARAFAVIKCL